MSIAKGIIVEIGGDTSKLQQALKSANSQVKSFSKELSGVNTLLKNSPDNGILNKQKYAVINDEIKALSDKLKSLNEIQKEADATKKIDKNSQSYRELQREIELTESKIVKLKTESSNWTRVGTALENVGSKISDIGDKAEKIGKKLTTMVTTTVVGIGTASIKSAIDFESAFAGVEKTVDGTEKQMANLRQGILDMSKELPSSAVEISSVAEAAGQLGIKTDDILSFTKVMIDLGNSTNLSADEAATALAKFANITNMSAKDYDRLGSVIVDLGNNFATTEADIVSMATNLAATGELTGLTEPQIMALATAMSSVGIEAQAGGSAMSKLLKKIQVAVELGSDELKDFAKVANMSSDEFAQAFQEDAVNALSAFIGGLNDTERNGKSAIAILDEMDIKEVRLSNTILSLANASGVMQNAITIANGAWEENTALTKEASKRYETFQSKIEKTKNKAKALGINIGERLLPEVDKLLDNINGLIEKFDKLSDEEKENIIKIAKFAAVVGPAVLVTGKLTKSIGEITSVTGKFFKTIGNVNGLSKYSAALSTVKTGIGAIAIAGTATIATMAIMDAYCKSTMSASEKEVQKLNNAINEQTKQREELLKQQESSLSVNLAEIDHTQKLANELKGIVDENGKIKEGYEARANFILGELNKALGTEYSAVDGVIQKYDELREEIDKLIEKKKAQIILDSEENLYRNALENQSTALKNQTDAYDKLIEAQERYKKAVSDQRINGITLENKNEINKALSAVDDAQEAYDKAKKLYEGYYSDIQKYEADSARVLEGSSESLKEVINGMSYTYKENGQLVKATTAEIIRIQSEALSESKRLYSEKKDTATETEKQIAEATIKSNQEQLKSTIDSLAEQTSTVSNSSEIIEAWKSLAENSYGAYSEKVSGMPEDLRKKIEEMTGVIATNGNTVIDSAGLLGNNVANAFDSANNASESGKNTTQAYLLGINDPNKKDEALSSAATLGIDVAKNLDASAEAEISGANMIEGFDRSINSGPAREKMLGSVFALSRNIITTFNSGLDEHSPSKESYKSGQYYLQGFMNALKNNKNNLLNQIADLSSEVNNSFTDGLSLSGLNSQVNNSVKNIFTTPQMVFYVQELNEQNLNKAFNYVNRRLGSQY